MSGKSQSKSRARRRAKGSAKKRATERIVHTRHGPLPESFFSRNRHSECLARKATLRAKLAKQYHAYVSARDDDEGEIRRRKAIIFALGAFTHWALAEGIPPQQVLPLIYLGSDLGDLLLGIQSESLQPIRRGEPRRGNPGRPLKDVARRAYACVAIDVLFRHQDKVIIKKELQVVEAEVARKVNIPVGALRSWRKALKAGRKKDPQTYRIYKDVLSECQRQPNPREAAHNLLAHIRGL